ncbi:PCYCGC motif-containing (lipo)protein [Paenibacillus harenae]|uniref:PCYCGC motif-containing (lipo)protein n=1 Tax=Paenibacillus harenae TaxID=306543 RepID=UPI00278DFAC9|nr:PCYCGC motif-containing (lipo)protein [Paenibacillus harenae]MDQ0057937.1 outer membrane murein-binding lipoprotein Lpp [Paenibacillus harenae]
MKKSIRSAIYLLVLAGFVLGGCSNNAHEAHNEETSSHEDQHHTVSGDLQERTASLAELPSFLNAASPTIRTAYAVAASLTDTLPYIPCYCGCGESAGHRSNLNCFIAEVKEDGSVVWDDHGTRCGVCMEIAVKTAAMKESGVELERIRQIIDDAYKEGYAKPTLTELPSA